MHFKSKIKHLFLYLILLGLISCSQDNTSFLGRGYHNTTAHYNAYYLAREKMKEVDLTIKTSQKDDYSKVLDVVTPITKETKGSVNANLEYIIKKAALPIKRHRNSKWVDDSYILVGKSRFYGGDYQLAIETFKYVNAKSEEPDSKHKALNLLMRTFIDSGSMDNATAVFDYLKKQKLNKENKRDFYLTQAYFLSKTERYKEMLPYLLEAVPSIKIKEDKARIYFVIAQIFQLLGNEKEAYKNYYSALRNNPPYELSFYTKLNLAQVTEVTEEKDRKRITKFFKKLLKDQKNLEYRDRIYYEMGQFELKQNNYDKGIALFEKSLRVNGNTKNQKGRTFLRLGRIYYENLKKYELASAYYDSTVTVWDQKDKDFKAISARQKVLKDFVVQIRIVQKEDSLQKLAKMDSTALNKFIDNLVAQEEKRLMDERKKQEKLERDAERAAEQLNSASNPFALNQKDPTEMPTAGGGGNKLWYFYNTSAVNSGKSDFIKRWGKRPLEDNWRRSNKEVPLAFNDQNEQRALSKDSSAAETRLATAAAGKKKAKNDTIKVDRKGYLEEIPFTEEQFLESKKKWDKAMYNLGKIYEQKLEEQDNAIKTFEELLERSPNNENVAEVLYFLYLIYQERKDPKEEFYKNKVLTEHPNSLYAKIIRNPNYLADSKIINHQIDLIYREAYESYNSEMDSGEEGDEEEGEEEEMIRRHHPATGGGRRRLTSRTW